MTTVETAAASSVIGAFVRELAARRPDIELLPPAAETSRYRHDAATAHGTRREPRRGRPGRRVPGERGAGADGGAPRRRTRHLSGTPRRRNRPLRRSQRTRGPTGCVDRPAEPHRRSLATGRGRRGGARRDQRRAERPPRAVRPVLRPRPGKFRDLVDRRQHRHQRRRTALRQVRRHPRIRPRRSTSCWRTAA